MKLPRILIAASLLFISSLAHSVTMTAICSDIKGSRIEYFLSNPVGKTNYKFLNSEDAVTNGYLKISWESGSREGLISIDDSRQTNTHMAKATMVFSGSEQLTFLSIINEAPFMVTLYPKSSIAVYSMQSNWGELASGVRANLLHAVCEIKAGSNL